MDQFKASVALLVGYLLIYAGVSGKGKNALRPWKALSA